MLLLVPAIFYSGVEMGFMSGDFTKNCVGDTVGNNWIGFVMAAFGAGDVVGSLAVSRFPTVLQEDC